MPIYYESRLAKLDNKVEIEELSDQDEVVEDEEDVGNAVKRPKVNGVA